MTKKFFKSPAFYAVLCIMLILFVRHIICENQSFYLPPYEYEKITPDDKADKIFKYTGLSPAAASELVKAGKEESINRLNSLYFKKPDIKKDYILFPFTAEEKLKNSLTPLAPLKNGDILVSFNTHTLDWRHGHIAIVTDAKSGIILEHMSVGNNSCLSYAKSWGSYPGFMILRHPDEKLASKAAKYASEHLRDVPYSIFAGILEKDQSSEEKIKSSHCSHIVWQAYKAAGEDIDRNGGAIVTPKDVAMCDKLSVVQIFGIDPKNYKDRLLND